VLNMTQTTRGINVDLWTVHLQKSISLEDKFFSKKLILSGIEEVVLLFAGLRACLDWR